MKKSSLLLVNMAAILMLASCGGFDDSSSSISDGRSHALAPDETGTTSYTVDNGCSKLSRAIKAMPSQKSLSFSMEDTSTLSSSGTVSKTYDVTDASSSSSSSTSNENSVTTYSVDVTNPIFEGAFTGLSGTKIADAKANLTIGGNIAARIKEDSKNETSIKVSGADFKAYLDDTYLYVDPRGCKTLIEKTFKTLLPEYSMVYSYLKNKIDSGYYFKHNLTDENMPLIKDDIFSDIDEYLSLFSDHAEDYKDFINIIGKDSTYNFYLTMSKEDLIKVLNDAEAKAKEDSSLDFETVDFAEKLADSTVNAFELLVTFTDKAVESVAFNIDMEIVDSEDIKEKDSNGNEKKVGTLKSVTLNKANGVLNLGQEEAKIPDTVNTTSFEDGQKLITDMKKIIDNLLKDFDFGDFDFGDFDFGDFDFGDLIKPAIL